MSMTLILWKGPVVREPEEAEALLEPFYEREDDSGFEPSPELAIVAAELRRLYPWRELSNEETVARMSEEERRAYTPEALKEVSTVEGGEPFADLPFTQTDRLLMVDVRWGADDAVIAAIVALARKYGMVLYDPQGPDVFLPTDPLPSDEPISPPTVLDWFKAIGIAAFLVGVTWAAWQIPIWWLKWPAVLIAGFIAAAGLFVVGLMIGAAMGWIDVEDGRTACTGNKPTI